MKKDRIIYPKCMDKTKPKATYITHDGYVRPCCFLHRHNQVEGDERWLNDDKHNLHSGRSMKEIFETDEYVDFFERLRTGKDVPERCIDVCKNSKRSFNVIGGSNDTRKERKIEGLEQYQAFHNTSEHYEDEYSVKHKIQIDATHRCSLSCSKCNRFIENFRDHYTGKTHKLDDGFKENMSRIAEAHPNSPMAQTYGTSRNHKELKTYNAITKHAKSIGKSHDLNAISQEYKQGQLVK